MAGAVNVVKSYLQNLSPGLTPKLVFSSNVTPDITINLMQLLESRRGPTPPATNVVEEGGTSLKLIRPEVILETFGRVQSFAPYGKPYKHTFKIIISSILAMGLISAAITWHVCRNKIVSKKNKALLKKLKTELGPEAVEQLKSEAAAIKTMTESS